MCRLLVLVPIVAVLGCGADERPADETRATVDVGIPSGDDGLAFAPLEPGDELRLQTFGQGGTHVLLGVRTRGIGTRAFVAMTLRNLLTGAAVTAPAPVRPQLFICEDSVCDLVPLLVMTAGLTEPGEERDGAVVEVRADVHDDSGIEASASRVAVLSTEDL